MEQYMQCFKVDIESIEALLKKEEQKVKLDLKRAEKKSTQMVETM